jgi:hypothetical protein
LKAFGLPTIEQLVKNPEDNFWEKKVKNGVSAGIAGVVIDSIYKTAKMFYNAGVQAIRNRKVYEPILEYSLPGTGEIIDTEFTEVGTQMLEKPLQQLTKGVK